MVDNPITEATFSSLYFRLTEFITANATLLFIGHWAKHTLQPAMRAWLDQLAGGLPEVFPTIFNKQPADPAAVRTKLDEVALEYHTGGVRALEAAALVFGHTTTDTLVDELLAISAKAVPERWPLEGEEFMVTLADLGEKTLEEYKNKARARLVGRWKAKALPEKLQYIFTVSRCGPRSFGKTLDIDLLSEADIVRHKIIHEGALAEPVERLNDMLGVLLLGAESGILAVGRSCGYEHVAEEIGFVFRPTSAAAEEPSAPTAPSD